MRTLLITGGSGYLGSHLARLARGSWRVVAAYFSPPTSLPGCETVRLDVGDRAAVARLLSELRPQAVVHTAADMRSPEAMEAVIVDGTRRVAMSCAAIGARLVHLSTDALFDGERAPYTESDPPSPITPYGRAKAAAEEAVAELYPEAAVVRTSLIYGFDPPDPRTEWVVEAVRQGKPITLFTDEVRCPVWVNQLAAALLELAAGEERGVWHLAGPQALSRYEFGLRLARAYSLDPAGITPGLSRDSDLLRPRDCRLDVSKARARLRSPLWGVDRVLGIGDLGLGIRNSGNDPAGRA
jgi:dTDP-4-dehydrorhamnose reductase